jgi:hypothetical protein
MTLFLPRDPEQGMSHPRTDLGPLPALVPPLLAAALLGAGLVAVPAVPTPATLALAAGVTLLRPRPAVWAAALLGLFVLGAASIFLSGTALPVKVVSLVLLAAGLVALAVWHRLREQKRWRSALDSFALRQMAAEQPRDV